ncbi:GGDEF domain-containing protein [Hafnia paralvei]|uniref:GGDEF domain-containing protein n=1 Tax=Hafnia paralvei TaxID=546367 RepID=UPI00241C3FC3|nr:GGDEF domain-containing protein [Hafnia paralvei]
MNAKSYDELLNSKSHMTFLLFILLNGATSFYALLNPLQTDPPYTIAGVSIFAFCLLSAISLIWHREKYLLKLNIAALVLGILWSFHIAVKYRHVDVSGHEFLLINLFSVFFIAAVTLSDNLLAFCLNAIPVAITVIILEDFHNMTRILFVLALPIIALSLHRVITRRREAFTRQLVNQLERDKARFSDLSMIDPLTTLLNRRGLEFQFHHMSNDCATEHKDFVVMIDIDFFKLYNDHYGHQYGDTALTAIAQIIKEAVRSRDLAVRYGGEEFLLILRDASETLAIQICEHIRSHVEQLALINEDQPNGYSVVTISAGLSEMYNNNLENAIARADQALYLSKQKGRNRVSLQKVA